MNAREKALQTLVQTENEQAFSNLEVNKVINSKELSPKDKNLYVNLVYGTLQHKLTIDHILKQFVKRGFNQLNVYLLWALRMAVYQIFFLTKIPDYAVIDSTVELVKIYDKNRKNFCNAVLRNILREKQKLIQQINNSKDLEVRYSVPKWIINEYLKTFGKQTGSILNNINKRAPLILRVKPENIDLLYKEFEKRGAEPEKKDNAIIIKKPSAIKEGINNNKFYKQGLFSVQDLGAMEISRELEPKPGEEVLDLCSAPGGKTIHIAELMNNQGKIIACDINPKRLELVEKTKKRTNSSIIETQLQDASKFNPDFSERFDKVLLDVPCSGLGVIKRKPDIRYRIEKKDQEELTEVQKKIIENGFKYLKDGGEMIYSTCTVGPTENEDIVLDFLAQNKQADLIEQKHISPVENGSDAFYYAKIKKNG